MLDGQLLAAVIASGDAYRKVEAYVSLEELSPQAQEWYKLVQAWYTRDPESPSVDRELLTEAAKREFSEKFKDSLLQWGKDLDTASPENVVQHVLELKKQNLRNEIGQAMFTKDGRTGALMAQYIELESATDLTTEGTAEAGYWTNDDEEQDNLLNRENLIPLTPSKLNDRIGGGTVAGDHIIIAGRPNVTKTLFAVAQTAAWARLGYTVLYVGNEESTYKTRKRLTCALAVATSTQYEQSNEKVKELAHERGLDNVLFYRLTPGTIQDVERAVKKVKPDIVILDQLRALGGITDKLTKQLEQNATAFRNLAGQYNFVAVSIVQAGESAAGKPFLRMEDISDSKTGIQGAVDLMIMIGMDEEMEMRGQRGITLPKNKLSEEVASPFVIDVDTARTRIS